MFINDTTEQHQTQVLLAIHLFWFACIGWVAFHEDTYEKHIKKPDETGQEYCDVFFPNGCTCGVRALVFEFLSQSSVLLYPGYGHKLTRYDTLIYITRKSLEQQMLKCRLQYERILEPPTLEHRYRLFLSSS